MHHLNLPVGPVDKFALHGVSLVSIIFGLCVALRSAPTVSPFNMLRLTTAFLSKRTVLGSNVSFTEVSALQGGGLADLPSLLRPLRLGSHFFAKLTVFLSLSFVLL